ncbi:hypothetical protein SVIOM74S_09729 [Streptomyces violarus]
MARIRTARVIAAVSALPLAAVLFAGVATADNGAFADNGSIASATEAEQGILGSGVGGDNFGNSATTQQQAVGEGASNQSNTAQVSGADTRRRRRMVTFTMDTSPEITVAQRGGHRRALLLLPDPLRRRRGLRHRPAGGPGDRRGRGGRGRLLPGVQRALGAPLRLRGAAPGAVGGGRGARLGAAVRPAHPGVVGGDGGPALPPHLRADHGGLRARGRRRPHVRGDQPGGVLPRPAHHPGRPRRVPLDRRTAAAAGLLPGDGRRTGARRHLRGTGPRPAPPARRDRGGRPGRGTRAGADDQLLPRRPHRPARDGGGGPAAVADLGARARRHRRGHPLRPLHAVRADAARGVRLLRPWRGPDFVAEAPPR